MSTTDDDKDSQNSTNGGQPIEDLLDHVSQDARIEVECKDCRTTAFTGSVADYILGQLVSEPECHGCSGDSLTVGTCTDGSRVGRKDLANLAEEYIGVSSEQVRDFILFLEEPGKPADYSIQDRHFTSDGEIEIHTQRLEYVFDVEESDGQFGPTGEAANCRIREPITGEVWNTEMAKLPGELEEVAHQTASRWWRTYGGDS